MQLHHPRLIFTSVPPCLMMVMVAMAEPRARVPMSCRGVAWVGARGCYGGLTSAPEAQGTVEGV